jgi:hypothetical protein
MTDKTSLTRDELLEGLNQAVAIYGEDYRYARQGEKGCSYHLGGGASTTSRCLFGEALALIGKPVPDEVEGQFSEVIADYYEADDTVMGLAGDDAQHEQDRGKSWGATLEYFKDSLATRDKFWGRS